MVNDQIPGSPQDILLNPPYAHSFCVQRAVGPGSVQVLPAAPLGKIWLIINGGVQGAAAASWSIREEVPGEVVRPMDVRSTAVVGTAGLPGGITTKGPLVMQNTGASVVTFVGKALAIPSGLLQRTWLQLTNVFQTVPLVHYDNAVLAVPTVGIVTPMWFNNADVAARTLEVRFTRGAASITNANTSTAAGTRTSPIGILINAFPPLRPGDILEARTTAAPAAATCFFGGAFQAIPELGLAA